MVLGPNATFLVVSRSRLVGLVHFFGLQVWGTITIFFVFRLPSTITNCFVLVV